MIFSPSFVGIDGCPSGWIISYKDNQNIWKFEVFSTIKSFWNKFSKTELVLIDIPIGLRDKGSEPRICDIQARKMLKRNRSSSIFPTPCRASLYADSYVTANQLNRKLTGKGLSKQTWNITKKIKQVDLLLRNNPKAQYVFIESHPELCFAVLSNDHPMKYYKKTEAGLIERLNLIKSFYKDAEFLLNVIVGRYSKNILSFDDILDSWVLAISASHGRSNLRFIPNNYEYDSEGLPMRMAIPKLKE